MPMKTNEDWVDFTEIPSGQGGGRNKFEEFARDFLETLGYDIIESPDVGGDRGRDLIVKDDKENIWLVSCKHYAHSENPVNKSDENDILDRIGIKRGCNNFLCFYSTFPGNSLQESLSDYKEQKGIGYDIFDREKIERYLIRNKYLHKVLARFFSKSFNRIREELKHQTEESIEESTTRNMNNSDFSKFYEASLTSSIVLEIDKVKEECFQYSKNEREMKNSLEKLLKYEEHKNDIILDKILELLVTIAEGGPRSWETSKISNILEGIIINYFTFGYYKSKQKYQSFFKHGKECINIGSFLVYDPFIHSKNYQISENGFSILKYVYHEGIKYKEETGENLKREVLQAFDWLDDALDRPERNNLEDAKEFLRVYREDLEEPGLMTPLSMPQRLLNLLG